jgi:hypothetical protein
MSDANAPHWRVLLSVRLSPPSVPTGLGETDRNHAVAYRIATLALVATVGHIETH